MAHYIRGLKWIVSILVAGLLLLPVVLVWAANPVVVITVQAWVVGNPDGLTLTYISDTEIHIEWEPNPAADITMVRAAYGHLPEDTEDGYEVYRGVGTNCTDDAVDLATPSIIYYRGWSGDVGGNWTAYFGSADTGGMMSLSFLFLTLVALSFGLFVIAFRWKDMLLSYASALTWFAVGFWWLLGDIENFGLEENWVTILVWIPFILGFTVLLRLMNTEIQHEKEGHSWSSWGEEPKRKTPSGYEEYRRKLFGRTRRR